MSWQACSILCRPLSLSPATTACDPSAVCVLLCDMRRSFRHHGCKFVVAGRLDSGTGRFLTLSDVSVPPELTDLFLDLPEDAFRADVSSSEIRERAAREARERGGGGS